MVEKIFSNYNSNGKKKSWVRFNIVPVLMVLALISSFATYYAISNNTDASDPHTSQILGLVIINIILLLALALFISNKITSLWLARKRGSAGSRLQTRIVVMFSLVSIIPTLIVAVFSIFYSIFVIQGWFSERVGTALTESVKVAEGYIQEHSDKIKTDALTMANYLNSQFGRFKNDPKSFARDVSTQARLLALNEAMVFRKSDLDAFDKSDVLARTQLSFALENEISYLKEKRPELLERADSGEVLTYISPRGSDKILALIKLYRFHDAYMIVGRFVDSKLLNHMELSKGAADEYSVIKSRLTSQQVQFGLVFVVVALLILLTALWVGINFAGGLVAPIGDLITATERVKAGDLGARVVDGPKDDEIATLGRAFNRMTDQLQKHNNEMLEIHRLIETRRRFIEDVLSGVKAGVVALDSELKITLFNKTSPLLLSIDESEMNGKYITEIFAEVGDLLTKVQNSPEKMLQDEISITRGKLVSALLVRVVREEFSDEIEGYIITFDDITELQSAQRSAAWSDVARRIAHEIKNPLTPIYLATERLRKKYGQNLKGDEYETFQRYLDTIARHVGNIGNIVEEFVSFARMPSPTLKQENIYKLIQESIFAQEAVYEDINFVLNAQSKEISILADGGQIVQLLTNLLKNAAEALQDSSKMDKKIEIVLSQGDYVNISIIDNGTGFPAQLIDRITEPYVTTKENGTGLGLAIVKKVIKDHNGSFNIANLGDDKNIITGAKVELSFPKYCS